MGVLLGFVVFIYFVLGKLKVVSVCFIFIVIRMVVDYNIIIYEKMGLVFLF